MRTGFLGQAEIGAATFTLSLAMEIFLRNSQNSAFRLNALFLGILPLLHYPAASAEDTIEPTSCSDQCSSDPDSFRDDIVVVANRRAISRDEVGSAISVIEAAQIQARQFQTVADALSLSPGVTLARNSAFGGVSSVSIRGASSRQTLVLLDGIVVNDPSSPGGSFNFANLDVADIDRIEVLRGPQSILYGSEAIGGVISITTTRADKSANSDTLNSTGFVEAGSFATIRAGLGLSGYHNKFDYRVSVFGTRTDGISRADEDDGNTEEDGFESIAASLNVGYEFNDIIRAESFARYGTSSTEFDGFPPPDFALADSNDDDSVEEFNIGARLIGDFVDDRFHNEVTLGYSRIERTNFSGDAVTFDATGDRLSIEYLGQFELTDNFTLTGGGESERTSIETDAITDDVRINSVFGLAEWRVFERTDQLPFDADLTVTGGIRHDDHSTFGGITTTRFTGALGLTDAGIILRGSWGEAFSAPSLFQLNFVFGPGEPNRDLLPESSTGFDIGLEKQFFSGNRDIARISVTYFDQQTDNLIDFNFATGAFFNINETRQQGIEVESVIRPLSFLSINAAYTYADAVDVATNLQALRKPEHRFFGDITLKASERLTLSLGATFNGEERDFGGTIDAFTRFDLRAQYGLMRNRADDSNILEIFARIENFTDSNYQDVLGFGEPGISAFGGIRVRL